MLKGKLEWHYLRMVKGRIKSGHIWLSHEKTKGTFKSGQYHDLLMTFLLSAFYTAFWALSMQLYPQWRKRTSSPYIFSFPPSLSQFSFFSPPFPLFSLPLFSWYVSKNFPVKNVRRHSAPCKPLPPVTPLNIHLLSSQIVCNSFGFVSPATPVVSSSIQRCNTRLFWNFIKTPI